MPLFDKPNGKEIGSVYKNDPDGMIDRMDDFLSICNKHGIRPMFVIFDDCWNPESYYGKQPDPKPGVHNSGWVQDPSVSLRADTTALFMDLEKYVIIPVSTVLLKASSFM